MSERQAGSFNPRTMLWVTLASLMAAAAFFVLSSYAPAFRQPGQSGATALSKAGTGFAGLVKLIELTDRPPVLVRTKQGLNDAALLIVPISPETNAKALRDLLARRAYKMTLVILPKWVTTPDRRHPGWEMKMGRLPALITDQVLGIFAKAKTGTGAAARRLSIDGHAFTAPNELQWVGDTEPYIAVGPGHALVTQMEGQPHYVLSDPDLMNNAGLADPARAAAALALIRKLRPNRDPVMFDLTLLDAGVDHSNDLQKLLIEPPFLALTLTLLVAAGLAFGHGFVRFGPPIAEERAIAFGKYALVDTTARLFRRAGRLAGLGDRYAALMRLRGGALLGAPSSLAGDALDAWLDARDRETPDGFTARARAVKETVTETEMRARAQALHDWIRVRVHG